MSQEPSPATGGSLLPCPFCGGEASHATCTMTRDRDSEGRKGTFTGHYINCIVCGSDNQGIAEGWRTPEQAAEKWNRRFALSETPQKPVAWRYKLKGSSMPWRLVESESDCNQLASYEREPLFASAPSATPRKPLPKRSAYSAINGGELVTLMGAFDPDIRLVTQDGKPAEAYYRIESDGEGVIVLKDAEAPQIADPKTNSGAFHE